MAKQVQGKAQAPASEPQGAAPGEPQAGTGTAGAPAGGDTAPASASAPTATPAAPGAAAEPAKKSRKAEHDWIGPNGDVVEEIEEATGIKYRSMGDDMSFSFQLPNAKPGDVLTMFALFGARTKATNSALAAREKRKRDAEFTATDLEHVRTLFGEIKEGQWGAPPAEGKTKGPKYDLDVLASVIAANITAAGGTADVAKIREKCGDSPAYVRGAIAFTDENGVRVFEREYNKRKGITQQAKSALAFVV